MAREARQPPGDAYVRIVRPYEDVFERGDEGGLVATERTVLDRPGWHAPCGAAHRAHRTPDQQRAEGHERLTKTKALAIFSSDNISSSAYATEEMMRILVMAGIGAISLDHAADHRHLRRPGDRRDQLLADDPCLPERREQLPRDERQPRPSRGCLVAGAALLIDYTLTVAVSVSAAVAAITSVVPELFAGRVLIAVAIVGLLMVGNLRGIRESGTIFMAPTYLYIAAMLGMVGFGLVAHGHRHAARLYAAAEWLTRSRRGRRQALASLLSCVRSAPGRRR